MNVCLFDFTQIDKNQTYSKPLPKASRTTPISPTTKKIMDFCSILYIYSIKIDEKKNLVFCSSEFE